MSAGTVPIMSFRHGVGIESMPKQAGKPAVPPRGEKRSRGRTVVTAPGRSQKRAFKRSRAGPERSNKNVRSSVGRKTGALKTGGWFRKSVAALHEVPAKEAVSMSGRPLLTANRLKPATLIPHPDARRHVQRSLGKSWSVMRHSSRLRITRANSPQHTDPADSSGSPSGRAIPSEGEPTLSIGRTRN